MLSEIETKLTRESCRLRPMKPADLEMVLKWRNSERVRTAMYKDHIISMEEHQDWYQRVTDGNTSLHFVFEVDGRPIGVVNTVDIDRTNNKCNWGFYIGDESAPCGAGSAMGFLALERLIEAEGFRKVTGEALGSNDASIRYHRKLGFVEEGRLVDHLLKNDHYVDVVLFAIFNRDWQRIRRELETKIFESRK